VSTSHEPVRLTADEAAAVLRRAVELDTGDSLAPSGGELIEVGTLEQAAAEVGLSPVAVPRAVAELRAGALEPVAGTSPATSTRLVGPRVAAHQRVLGLTPDQVERAGRVLQRQLFELRRADMGRALWRQRRDSPPPCSAPWT
jgi:hypothetical protein